MKNPKPFAYSLDRAMQNKTEAASGLKKHILLYLGITIMLFIINSAIAQTDCRLESSLNLYMNANSYGGTYGYYLKEVNGDVLASRNENYAFYPASSMKVFLHAYAIKNFALSTNTSAYTFNESCDDDHTGSTPIVRNLQAALPIMMVNSGNATTNAVMELIGNGNAATGRTLVNDMLANNFGLSGNTKVNHKLGCGGPDNNPANRATAKDFARFYDLVRNSNYLSNSQKTWFKNLMISDTSRANGYFLWERVRDEVDKLVNQYNLNNLSSDDINDFKNGVKLVHKAGNIGKSYLSNAGWISFPFKNSVYSNTVTDKEYTYALFYDNADSVVVGATATTIELLRNELLAALQTWNAKRSYVNLNGTYTSETVGELITPEIGTTDDALGVVAISSGQAVTPIRDAYGRLKLISWSITNNGATITRQKSYTTGSYITAVKAVTLSNDRMVTACRLTNGNLQLIYWRVDNSGNFTIKDVAYAGEVGEVDLVKMSSNRVATPVSTAERDMKVIIWDIGLTEQITRKGDGTVQNADIVSGASLLSSMRLATATKNRYTGNLEVQYWSVSYSGYPTLKSTASAGAIDDVSVTGLNYTQFVTNVIQSNTVEKSILWEICLDGTIQRKGDGTHSTMRDIASEQVTIGKRQMVVGRDSNNKLNMSVWDTESEGRIMKSGYAYSETIGQAEVAVLNSVNQQIIIAYTDASDMLKIRTGSIDDYLKVIFAFSGVSTEGLDVSTPELAETQSLQQAVANGRDNPINSTVEATTMGQNYPNPFSDETTIHYALKEDGRVELTVMDFKGNEVLTLVSDEKKAGHHNLTLSGHDLPKGIYFYKLKSGNETIIKKMIHK